MIWFQILLLISRRLQIRPKVITKIQPPLPPSRKVVWYQCYFNWKLKYFVLMIKLLNYRIYCDTDQGRIHKSLVEGGGLNPASGSGYTICPRNSDPFYIVSCYIKWVTTSWAYSRIQVIVGDITKMLKVSYIFIFIFYFIFPCFTPFPLVSILFSNSLILSLNWVMDFVNTCPGAKWLNWILRTE